MNEKEKRVWQIVNVGQEYRSNHTLYLLVGAVLIPHCSTSQLMKNNQFDKKNKCNI